MARNEVKKLKYGQTNVGPLLRMDTSHLHKRDNSELPQNNSRTSERENPAKALTELGVATELIQWTAGIVEFTRDDVLNRGSLPFVFDSQSKSKFAGVFL